MSARDVITDLEKLIEDSTNAYDDWLAARGITTVRRRYRDERDAALDSNSATYTRFPRLWEKVHIIYQDGTEHTAESFKLDWNNPNIKEYRIVEGGYEPRE